MDELAWKSGASVPRKPHDKPGFSLLEFLLSAKGSQKTEPAPWLFLILGF
jgi:hypothetical protein